jgi:hypothetical protein
MVMSFCHFSFLLHALVETPACINFLLFPDDQLPVAAPPAHAIIRQYAVLLFCSIMIAVTFAYRSTLDVTSGKVAGALAFYHIAPLVRAWSRINTHAQSDIARLPLLKNPWSHFVIHSLCLGSLGSACWNLYMYNYVPWI